jgi:hypothetical protein
MSEIKHIDPRALGSITSGVLLLDDFSKVHEAIEWLLGHPVWTHELPSIRVEASAAVDAQIDGMPHGPVLDYKETADFLLKKHGFAVPINRGTGTRKADPITTAMQIMGTGK